MCSIYKDKVYRNSLKHIMINNIILENFKSYVGIHRIGPFHKEFNTVSGPNGSGKSNLIDGLLFVFFKRFNQLRFSRISELIHNSFFHHCCVYTKVDVHLTKVVIEDENKIFILPGSELIISRLAYKDNKSCYFINNRPATREELSYILNNLHIDIDKNRFFILQGEIEHLSSMKSKVSDTEEIGLSDFLENTIGSKLYIRIMQKLSEKLDKMSEDILARRMLLKTLSSNMNHLNLERLETAAFVKEKFSLLCLEMISIRLIIYKSNKQYFKFLKTTDQFVKKLTCKNKLSLLYKISIEKSEKKFDNWMTERKKICDQLEKVEEQFKFYEQKDLACREKTKVLNKEKFRLFTKNIQEKIEVTRLNREILIAKKKLFVLQILSDNLNYRRNYFKENSIDISILYNKTIDLIRVPLKSSSSPSKKYKLDKEKIQEIESALANYKRNIINKQKNINKLKNDLVICNRKIEKKSNYEQQLKKEKYKFLNIFKETQNKLNEIYDNIYFYVNKKNVFCVLKYAKKNGQLKGIFGRLGDLGSIDAKYDIAVSTACTVLDYIVVDKSYNAEKCVEFLRINKIGVATFIILKNQKHLVTRMMKKPKYKFELAYCLFDLVRVQDEKFRVAFYYGLRDCLVTRNLQQAMCIAYEQRKSKSYKIVSMEGELIQESGTISGGGKNPYVGRMLIDSMNRNPYDSSENIPKSIEFTNQFHSLQTKLNSIRNRLEIVQGIIEKLDQSKSSLKCILHNLEDILNHENEQVQNYRKIIINSETNIFDGDKKNKNQDFKIFKDQKGRIDCIKYLNITDQRYTILILESQIEFTRLAVIRREMQILKISQVCQKKFCKIEKKKIIFEENHNKEILNKHNLKIIEDKALVVMQIMKDLEIQKENKIKVLNIKKIKAEIYRSQLNNIEIYKDKLIDKIKEIVIRKRKIKEKCYVHKQHLKKDLDNLYENLFNNNMKLVAVKNFIFGGSQLYDSFYGFNPPNCKNKDDYLDLYDKTFLFKKNISIIHLLFNQNGFNLYKLDVVEKKISEKKLNIKKNENVLEPALINKYFGYEKEYNVKMKYFEFLTRESNIIVCRHEKIRKKRIKKFVLGFNKINKNLRKIYTKLTLGGKKMHCKLKPFHK
eukprot:gnl/TRDRNA2_/TRDRNA2_178056_c0_seq39.p1 gnl/TRDRNA2_/TRDRNA2_178056_c0~~gnl/TRDRNA2_/TRDRNA2_178056_c0_seq39.p1  ORF type:complete len:1119 (-),score=39.58 gnl/TRDRNA2_/TRDRNA2_178056_c0_seq39:4108-7464(-)